MNPILISNSFPFSLIRRHVTVEPRTVAELVTAMHERPWVSAWGHENTSHLANALLGTDVLPKTVRPELSLTEDKLPKLERETFTECWLLSPNYTIPNYRPKTGEEVSADKIRDWQVLRLSWPEPQSAAQPAEDGASSLRLIASSLERIEKHLGISQNPPAKTVAESKPVTQDVDRVAKVPEAPEAAEQEDTLSEFLADRGIKVRNVPETDLADEALNQVARRIGRQYEGFRNVLASLKRLMSKGMGFSENISNLSQQEIQAVTQICSECHKLALLEDYRYQRSPNRVVHIKTSTLPRAQSFFSGQWLERFLLGSIEDCCQRMQKESGQALTLEVLANPQIILPNGDDFEMDILAAVNGEKVYWFEAKTGDYQRHAAKYSKFSRQLGLGAGHSLMILTDVDSKTCGALGSIFTMSVCNIASFENTFLEALRRDFPSLNDQAAAASFDTATRQEASA